MLCSDGIVIFCCNIALPRRLIERLLGGTAETRGLAKLLLLKVSLLI